MHSSNFVYIIEVTFFLIPGEADLSSSDTYPEKVYVISLLGPWELISLIKTSSFSISSKSSPNLNGRSLPSSSIKSASSVSFNVSFGRLALSSSNYIIDSILLLILFCRSLLSVSLCYLLLFSLELTCSDFGDSNFAFESLSSISICLAFFSCFSFSSYSAWALFILCFMSIFWTSKATMSLVLYFNFLKSVEAYKIALFCFSFSSIISLYLSFSRLTITHSYSPSNS